MSAVMMAAVETRTVTAVHVTHPFAQEVSRRCFPIGTTFEATKPHGVAGGLTCKINGECYVPPHHWPTARLTDGDVIEWEEWPQGGGKAAGYLQIVIGIIASIATMNPAPAFIAFASVGLAAMQSKPALRPRLRKESSTYTTGLSGNEARLYEVVPKICGRHRTFPPYAAQAYQEFDENGDQYLYVLLALGIGNHEIERMMIDDTDISHFADVLTAEYLPPGTYPTEVIPNVINSLEVGGQDMISGDYIGGFAVCSPRTRATHIGIDVVAPNGIGEQDADTGDLTNLEVSWRVETRPINEFGSATGQWAILALETRTAADREPQRWSVKYELEEPARVEVRIVRMDAKSANVLFLNDLQWTGMRAYLEGTAPLNDNVAHIEVVMRASKQLNNVSQNRIAVIATGMCRELLEDGTFGDEIASRNPADWLADLWTSTTWGEGIDPSMCDLATLAEYKALWAQRQDRFDFVFDTSISAEEAGQIIAGAGRARCFTRNGVRTLVRDQLSTLPRTAFTTRNTVVGSMVADEQLPDEDLPDGLIVEYMDNRSWNYGQPIECPAPGVVSMVRPERIRLQGITGSKHAKREGLFQAARMVLRRRQYECTTEMQAALAAFGSLVRWQTEVTRWRSGDVVSWDADNLLMRLTDPPNWERAPQHIVLVRDDGTPTQPIEILPGGDPTSVHLASDPGFTPSTEDGTRERTQYLLGKLGDDEELVKISEIEDDGEQGGVQQMKVRGFVDDERIHTADNAYLPSPGEIQDPIDTSPGEPGGGTIPIVNMNDHILIPAGGGGADYFFLGNGQHTLSTNGGVDMITFENEWLFGAPVEASFAALCEVRFTLLTGVLDLGNGYLDAWLPCGVDYRFAPVPASDVNIRVEVRLAETGVVQDTCNIQLGIIVEP